MTKRTRAKKFLIGLLIVAVMVALIFLACFLAMGLHQQ
jgi:cell division protein FtsB